MAYSSKKIRITVLFSLLTMSTLLVVPTTTYADTQTSTTSSSSSTPLAMNIYASSINLANYKTYEVIGSGTSGDTINVTISDNHGNRVRRTTEVGSHGVWIIRNLDVSQLSDGKIQIAATQISTQMTVTNKTFSTTKNTTVPVAPTVSKKQETIKKSNSTEYTVSGTGTPGCLVHITLTDSNGHTVKGETAVTSNGTWTDPGIDADPLSRGHVYIDAFQTNKYKNSGPKSAAVKTTKAIEAKKGLANLPLHFMSNGKTSTNHTSGKAGSSTITPDGSEYLPSSYTGIFILNNRNAVFSIDGYGIVGHVGAGILLSDGGVWYESFDTTQDSWRDVWGGAPGKWDLASSYTEYGGGIYFSSVYKFRKWLETGTTGYDLNNIVFIKRSSSESSAMSSQFLSWWNNTPQYCLPFFWPYKWDCETMTNNIVSKGNINPWYFKNVNPNWEQDNLVDIALYGYDWQYDAWREDPSRYSFTMWNPANNDLWW
ncbi:hypothetical protein [Alicyclobacillus sp. SO9]|uniref:hypothetical protein n=1 Tax=Alicyclobacillus sp. SO9 TaxID=2665646 RepID=UPI0018E7D8F6|nr:hypothetical protein [Alicyclobacillus sp. SO9]QQE79708.1 hypothetical protein GI364_04250 [Alicyclobacillus sp. SO9]